MKKELYEGWNLIPKVKNKLGEEIYDRKGLYDVERIEEDKIISDRSKEDNSFPQILTGEVICVLANLNINRATGGDSIENRYLRLFAEELATPFAIIFNLLSKRKLSQSNGAYQK